MRRGSLLQLCTILILFLVRRTWALQGDSWCGTLMCVDAIVNGSTVTYELKALNQLGWMSIGFGPHMAEAPLVVMWPNENGSVILSQRVAGGHVPPEIDPDPPRIATISAHVDLSSDTSPILAFDIPKDNTTNQSLIWAFGVARPAPDASSDIEQHLDAGSFSLDLSKNRDGGKHSEPGTSSGLGSTIASSATSSSTPTPSIPEGASLTSAHAVSTAPSSLSSASALPQTQPLDSPSLHAGSRRNILLAHAILSFFGFCVGLPISAIVTRWCRTAYPYWLRVHWYPVAFLAAPLGTIGWALGPAVVAVHGQRHVDNEHQIGGVILFALCLVQVTSGVFIHRRQPKHGRLHPLRNYAHVLLGLAIIGFSFFVAKTGLARDATLGGTLRKALSIACVIISILVALAYLTGVARLRRQFDQERLGWHLSLSSGSTITRTGLFRHQREARRAFEFGQRSGIYQPDDDSRNLRRSTSSNGPVPPEGNVGTPGVVEMRELQRAVPISASLRPLQYATTHAMM